MRPSAAGSRSWSRRRQAPTIVSCAQSSAWSAIPDQPGRQVDEARKLARQGGGELRPIRRFVVRQLDPRGVAQRVFDFVLTRTSA